MARKLKIAEARRQDLDSVVSGFMGQLKKSGGFSSGLEYIAEKTHDLEEFIKPGKSPELTPRNQLIVLRKWNSYTPLLPPSRDEYARKGGGYFMRCGDVGIVVDPGFNFIEHFLRAGFKLDDIDHVFISHAHNDHTVELEGLFALLHKRNSKWDKLPPKTIRLYMNLGSFKKFGAYFDLSGDNERSYIGDIVLLNKHHHLKFDTDMELFTTQAKHHEMITKQYALGFTFCFRLPHDITKVVKFTCDTGWDGAQEKDNAEKAEGSIPDVVDLLVAHIGSVKNEELEYDPKQKLNSTANKKCLYKHHLGLLGTVAAVHFWKPSLTLVSEFGEELDALRTEIAAAIGKGLKTPVFATDVNFRVDLESLNIRCTNTHTFHPTDEVLVERGNDHQLYAVHVKSLTAVQKRDLKLILGTKIGIFE